MEGVRGEELGRKGGSAVEENERRKGREEKEERGGIREIQEKTGKEERRKKGNDE